MPESRIISHHETEPVNLVAPARVVRGRLPAIEAIQDRLSRQLRADLFRELRYGVQVHDASTSFEAHDDVMSGLQSPVYVGIVSMPPLRGFSVIAIDGALAGAVVDRLCGATEPDPSPRREDFSQLEIRLAKRLMKVVTESLQFAWHGVASLQIDVVRTEMNTSFIAIADADESLIAMRMTASMATGGGQILVATPYPSIDPVRERLATTAAMTETPESDKRHWREQIKRAADEVPIELHADIAHTQVKTSLVQTLALGQIIPIRIPGQLKVYSDHTPLFEAEYGSHGDNYAVRVSRFNGLDHSSQQSEKSDDNQGTGHEERGGEQGGPSVE